MMSYDQKIEGLLNFYSIFLRLLKEKELIQKDEDKLHFSIEQSTNSTMTYTNYIPSSLSTKNTEEHIQKCNSITKQSSSLHNEYTKKSQWDYLHLLTILKDFSVISDTYPKLITIDNDEVTVTMSNQRKEIVLFLLDILQYKDYVNVILSILTEIYNQQSLIKNTFFIRIIIAFNPSSEQEVVKNNLITEIKRLIKEEAIFEKMSDYLLFYVTEKEDPIEKMLGDKEDNNEMKKISVTLWDKKNQYKNKFDYSIDKLKIIKEFLTRPESNYNAIVKTLTQISCGLQKYNHSFSFKYSIDGFYNHNEQRIIFNVLNSIELQGKVKTKEYNHLKKLCDDYKLNSPYLEEIKSFSFIPTEICVHCSKIIKEDDHQYYCYWCNISYCIDCVENTIKENKGRDCYLHKEHNLLYFKTKKKENLEDLDEYKLGTNLFATCSDEDFHEVHDVMCNGCSGNLNSFQHNERYLCITCRPGIQKAGGYNDYCTPCIVQKRTNKNFRDYSNESRRDHFDDTHVHLLIIHQVRNYYNY